MGKKLSLLLSKTFQKTALAYSLNSLKLISVCIERMYIVLPGEGLGQFTYFPINLPRSVAICKSVVERKIFSFSMTTTGCVAYCQCKLSLLWALHSEAWDSVTIQGCEWGADGWERIAVASLHSILSGTACSVYTYSPAAQLLVKRVILVRMLAAGEKRPNSVGSSRVQGYPEPWFPSSFPTCHCQHFLSGVIILMIKDAYHDSRYHV